MEAYKVQLKFNYDAGYYAGEDDYIYLSVIVIARNEKEAESVARESYCREETHYYTVESATKIDLEKLSEISRKKKAQIIFS